MQKNFEEILLEQLITNEKYTRKVLPYLKKDYFSNDFQKDAFSLTKIYFEKYNVLPTKEALFILYDKLKRSEEQKNDFVEYLDLLKESSQDFSWLVEETESYCKDKALYNAIMNSIQVLNDDTKNKHEIRHIVEEALAVSFDTHLGHDFFENMDDRYAYYHEAMEKIPFDIDLLNKATDGGIERKTLNLIMASTGVGKSLGLCHLAGTYLKQGLNVVYFTLEMREEKISERVDANFLDTPIYKLRNLEETFYKDSIKRLSEIYTGKIVVKEYPTSTAHVGHFKSFLNELKLKKKFVPDVIIIDYLGICTSSRVKSLNNINTYTYSKFIAEEVRGLGIEMNAAVWSAVQTNRGGMGNEDLELTETSESVGQIFSVDYMIALIATKEMLDEGKLIIKQLKSRYGDINYMPKIAIGIDRAKMRWYNLDSSAQNFEQTVQPQKKKSNFNNIKV